MLEKAAEYARNAREAVDLASRTHTSEDHKVLMHMAETWLLLAQAAVEHGQQVTAEPRRETADTSADAASGASRAP